MREAAARASVNVTVSANVIPVAPQPGAVDAAVSVLGTGRDFMGENPVWCNRTGQLWWLDILAPALRARNISTGASRHILLDDLTGGLALTESGKLLLAGRQGVHLFDPETRNATLLFDPEKHKPENRFNSASVDASGNLWVGTMRVDGNAGGGTLYRIGKDLSVQVALPEVALPKNVGWSPDGSEMYLSQGGSGRLEAYPLEPGGLPGAPRTVVQGGEETGQPNGVAVDAEGCIWVAMTGAWTVNRYTPGGELLRRVFLPLPIPTALAFGGPDLDRLFVTSTYLRMPGGYSSLAPQAGNLIEIDAGVRGAPIPRFGI